MKTQKLLAVLCMVVAAAAARSADPWHLAGCQARVIVEVTTPSTEPGVDTASVKVLCQGRAKPDGSDYRVLDSAGKPVPFQVMFHDAQRYSLLSFRCDNPKQKYFVYFGNPAAARAPEEVVADAAPGSGAPKGAWVPRYGFVLQTIQRPEGENPQTVTDMAKLMAGSKEKYGARFQRQVSEGYNVFGPSDYYISIYRGWVRVPKAGKYQFCTASNEASFSFLDGKELVHWPGRHTSDRGARGEVNATVDLTEGLHYLEYYHEEVTLEQMAFLGWRPPDATTPGFFPIPEPFYTSAHHATVTRYEDAKGPVAHFEPVITDSIWPISRHEGQYTRCRFQASKSPALPAGTVYEWDFGDGQKASGAEVEHVYLTLGTRFKLTARSLTALKDADVPEPVVTKLSPLKDKEPDTRENFLKALAEKLTKDELARFQDRVLAQADTIETPFNVALTAQGPAGTSKATWPLLIFEIEHVTDQFREGRPADYAKLAKTYDRAKLDASALAELAHLFADADETAEAIEVGKAFIARFPNATMGETASVRRLMADCSLRLGKGSIDEAIANYQASLYKEMPATAQIDVLTRLIRLVGIERNLPDKVPGMMKQVDETFKNAKRDRDTRDAYRRAVIAAGDVLLWHGKMEGARTLYKQAESFGPSIPQQVHDARAGAYPNSLREYIGAGNYGAAIDLVDRWEETFPTDKVKGQTLYWRGKVLLLRGQAQESLRFLDRAVRLTIGAGFETEARWLLAEALDQVGRKEDSRKELAKIVASRIDDEFTQRAKKKLLTKPEK